MTTVNSTIQYDYCPDCQSDQIWHDQQRGEKKCVFCGLVISNNCLDETSQGRSIYDKEQESKRSRVGIPINIMTPDINFNVFVNPKEIKDPDLARAIRWNNTNVSRRSLYNARGELKKIASKFDLTTPILDSSMGLMRRAINSHMLKGRSVEGVAYACLYYSIRIFKHSLSFDKLIQDTQINPKKIKKYYKSLIIDFNLKSPPTDPYIYIARFISELKEDYNFEKRVTMFVQSLEQVSNIAGKDPKGVCCASIYIIGKSLGQHIRQKRLAELADVTEATIRARLKEIRNLDLTFIMNRIEKDIFMAERKADH